MGLRTTHDCFHGAYSSFNRWRQYVAKAAGYHIYKVDHQNGEGLWDVIMIEWHRSNEDTLMGIWDEPAPNPLYYLFIHSDCEGEIYPDEAIPLADELEKLIPKLEGFTEPAGHIAARGGIVGVTQKFIDGLRKAADAGEAVEFH